MLLICVEVGTRSLSAAVVILFKVCLMIVSHPWGLCYWFLLVFVKHHVYFNYVHPFAMFTCCSYFISCSKVVTLIKCADVCIKLLLWCLIVSDPCLICISSNVIICSLLCVLWCHALICHDMVAVHIVIELPKCILVVCCQLPWFVPSLDSVLAVLHALYIFIHGSFDHKCYVWTDHHHIGSMLIYSMVMLLLIC